MEQFFDLNLHLQNKNYCLMNWLNFTEKLRIFSIEFTSISDNYNIIMTFFIIKKPNYNYAWTIIYFFINNILFNLDQL
jgi:hypothetical protein